MSSRPGLDLQDYVAWMFDVVVQDQADPNFSLAAAELLGTAVCRRRIAQSDFKKVIRLFEPWRVQIEDKLLDFNEDTQSWRDYACYAFDFVPNHLLNLAYLMLRKPQAISKEAIDAVWLQSDQALAEVKELMDTCYRIWPTKEQTQTRETALTPHRLRARLLGDMRYALCAMRKRQFDDS